MVVVGMDRSCQAVKSAVATGVEDQEPKKRWGQERIITSVFASRLPASGSSPFNARHSRLGVLPAPSAAGLRSRSSISDSRPQTWNRGKMSHIHHGAAPQSAAPARSATCPARLRARRPCGSRRRPPSAHRAPNYPAGPPASARDARPGSGRVMKRGKHVNTDHCVISVRNAPFPSSRPVGGHPGRERTLKKVARRVWWPTLS